MNTNDMSALVQRALKQLKSARTLLDEQALQQALSLTAEQTAALIARMQQDGQLVRTKRGKLAVPAHLGVKSGMLMGTQRGDAFFEPTEEGGETLFISQHNRHGAMHQDTVLVSRVNSPRQNRMRRAQGEVVSIVARAHETVVGTVMRGAVGGGVLRPEERRLPDIILPQAGLNGANDGQLAVCRLIDYGDELNAPKGEIIQILGESGTIEAGLAAIYHEHDLEIEFDTRTLKQAQAVPTTVLEKDHEGREDLSGLITVTIDGADAKDFDDAISLQKTDSGYELAVHIADVSHYVMPGSALDKTAYLRATSVYVPGRVLPMLPEALSNGICSLNQQVERLTLSCLMTLDEGGTVKDYRFVRSVIVVDKRVTYEDANALYADPTLPLMAQYEAVWPMLERMKALGEILTKKRLSRGALDFSLNEPAFTLDESGQPIGLYARERGSANLLIEEFMLLANTCAAQMLKAHALPALYRVHEQPAAEKMESLFALLDALGITPPQKAATVTPLQLQHVLEETKGEKYEMAVSRVMLRTLKKACYSERPLGHFGLALKDYCHFTSPIRRYPDLLVHRAIIAHLEGGWQQKAMEHAQAIMPQAALHTSERERASMEAERAADDLFAAAYMQGRIGEEFLGVITGVLEFGMFVQVLDTVEGLVPASALGEEPYRLDPILQRLTGQFSGRVYTLGDEVKVRLVATDLHRRRIDFVLAETPAIQGRPKTARPKPKARGEKGAVKGGRTKDGRRRRR